LIKQASKTVGLSVATLILVALLNMVLGKDFSVYTENYVFPGKACPLSDNIYKASLVSTELKGRVGSPVLILLNLSPYLHHQVSFIWFVEPGNGQKQDSRQPQRQKGSAVTHLLACYLWLLIIQFYSFYYHKLLH